MFIKLNLNGKIQVIVSLTMGNNKLDLIGILGEIRSSQSRKFLMLVARYLSVSHPVPITQMFQPSGLVVMSIAATRMHRSLTDFTGYYASYFIHSAFTLTATEVAVLSMLIRLIEDT